MDSEFGGENLALISRELRSLVEELVPDITTFEEGEKTIFFYRKNICYLQDNGVNIQFGFFGDDPSAAGKQKAVCFFTFTAVEQVEKCFLQKLLKIYIT